MRILVVHPGAHFSVADAYDGWVEALRELGCSVAAFNYGDRLSFYARAQLERDGELRQAFSPSAAADLAAKGIQAACYEFLPDVVLVVSCFFVPMPVLDLCRARSAKVAILHLEEPYETDRELERAAHADLNLINDPTHLDRFTAVAPTIYTPAAYRPSLHRPGPVDPDLISDFAFVGTGFDSRIAFLEAVDWTGIDVALAGNWPGLTETSPLRKFLAHDIGECCPNSETVRLYQATATSMNTYRRETSEGGTAAGWSMSPREIELAATGTFFLREARGEGDEILPMLPTFDGPADFETQLRWWLAHPEARNTASVAARAAITDRTFSSNAARFLELLGH
jgi:spore maturation protein CgeB